MPKRLKRRAAIVSSGTGCRCGCFDVLTAFVMGRIRQGNNANR